MEQLLITTVSKMKTSYGFEYDFDEVIVPLTMDLLSEIVAAAEGNRVKSNTSNGIVIEYQMEDGEIFVQQIVQKN